MSHQSSEVDSVGLEPARTGAAAIDDGAPPPTRVRILEACNALFIERGASNVSVEDVADAAGVGRATIYRHFAGREAMTDAAVAHYRRGVIAQLETAVETHQSYVGRIGALAATFAQIAAETRIDKRIGELHDHHLADIFVTGIHRVMSDTTDFVEPLIIEAIEAGELDGEQLDTRSYADWVARMLVGVILVPGSAVVDIRDPAQVDAYVRAHLLVARPPIGIRSPERA